MLAPMAMELLADCLFMLLIGWGWETLRGTVHHVRLSGTDRESNSDNAWYHPVSGDFRSPRVGNGATRREF
jgi:hypothetical protein